MSDDLRTRIAAVLEAQHVSEFQGTIHPEDVLRLADAVIRELGLQQEYGECGYCHAMLPGCRYVTEWTADE